MERRVFYSWQSLNPSINRSFIEGALEAAAKEIHNDDNIEIEPVIDRDTAGLGGSPDIAAAVLNKIDGADVFVCDVSFIGLAGKRPVPNPNVLIELGYAIRSKGWEKVVMVFNDASGAAAELPFDLRTRRAIRYCAFENESDQSGVLKALATRLEEQLRAILPNAAVQPVSPDVSDLVKQHIEARRPASLRDVVMLATEKVAMQLNGDRFDSQEQGTPESFERRVTDIENLCVPLAKIVGTGCYYDSDPAIWIEAIDRIANAYQTREGKSELNWWTLLRGYATLIVFYAGGIGALAASRYNIVTALLSDTRFFNFGGERKALVSHVAWSKTNQKDLWNAYITKANRHTPVSDRLRAVLREPLRDVILQEQRYEAIFDRFEYLLGLYVFANDDRLAGQWGPVGTFIWTRNGDKSLAKELEREVKSSGDNAAVVKAQFVSGDGTAFLNTLQKYEDFVNTCRRGMGVGW